MRITEAEHQAIRQAITEADPEANIYLFGSRANDDARGGDIDLLIISSAKVAGCGPQGSGIWSAA